MNNVNGAALLARVKPGCLVTIRREDGGQSTGRARWHELMPGAKWLYDGRQEHPITESNIINVRD